MKTNRLNLFGIFSAAAASMVLATGSAHGMDSENTRWTWCGWGGGGYFWSNAIDPVNPNIMYLGGDVVGMYKSTDRGKNWRLINNGLHEYGVYSMAISRSNPKVLYAMTPNGVARTDNGGEKWTPLPETFKSRHNLSSHRPGSVRALAVDPVNPGIVYAGSAMGVVCKSTDGGMTWSELDYLSALESGDSPDPVAPASGDGFMWAAFKSVANDWKHSGRIEKYYDKGQDWTGMKELTSSFYAPSGAPTFKVALVVQSGADWKWEHSAFVDSKAGEWVDLSFDLSSINDIKDIRMVHVWVMANGAAFNGELGIDAVRVKPQDSSRSDIVLGEWDTAGANEGWRPSKSADSPFITAIRSSLAPATVAKDPVGSVVVSEADPSLVFICHRKLGTFRSKNGGAAWELLDTPKTSINISTYKGDPKLLYGAFDKAGVWKSVDGGDTWTKFSDGLNANYGVREIRINPKNPNKVHLIAVSSWAGIYYGSDDGGKTWTGRRSFTRDYVGNPTEPDGHPGGKKDLSACTNLAI
ncbi:MAG: hypothetical protein GX804_09240, partial [Lentisphaerae bacterium]|nr:hypothetical protein [Lentisphaerota bacterium]